MNVIKKSLSITLITALFFLNSCEKDLDSHQNDSSLTEEIGKVETSYQEGDVKLENINDGIKIETDAEFSLKEKIKNELENSFSKNQTYLKNSGRLVGVFKNGSCGSYKVLNVYMDCEDKRPNTSKTGWTGNSGVSGGNATLQFCVVNGAYFERTNDKVYGVLRLYAGNPSPNSFFRRHFDNEDKKNANSVTLDGKAISGVYGFCKFDRNTLLSFYYYPKTNRSRSFPSLGISYGVLGTFGSVKGSIYTDDEDKRNANWASVDEYDDARHRYKPYYYINNINFHGLMHVGGNTRIYISKAR